MQRGWCRDALSPYVWIKVDPHWSFVSDERGSGDRESDTPRWADKAFDSDGRLDVRLGTEPLTALVKPPEEPKQADALRIVLNPPERIALKDGSWLEQTTAAYAWLEAGGRPLVEDGVEVWLEVLTRGGTLQRTASQKTVNGHVAFAGQPYQPGDTVFRARTVTLHSPEVSVRPSPPFTE